MSEFDPYYLWMGIPPEEQPPNDYRLLGITLYEKDAAVIEAAADRQMAYVKTHATGPHSALSQQLLNEISVARVCLLKPKKKAEYDQELKAQLAAEQAASQPDEPAPRRPRMTHSAQPSAESLAPAPQGAMPQVQPQQAQPQQAPSGFVAPAAGQSKLRRKKPLWQQPAVIAGVFGGLLALVLIIYLIGRNRRVEVVDNTDPTDRKTQVETLPEKSDSPFPTEKKQDAPPQGKISDLAPSAFAGARAGQEWDGNALKMKFCWCPPGKFTMGSPRTEPGRRSDENQVEVTLTRGFWLGKYEVTQAQWKAIMGTQPWVENQDVKTGDDYPVSFVSCEEAVTFCLELTKQERAARRLPPDWQYRLPTEAQWEYACRAGSKTRYSFGDDDSRLGDYAWFKSTATDLNENYAHHVGIKRSNVWGFHDMHGNVWEWCRDWH